MVSEPRHTHASLKVLKLFLDNPHEQASGAEVGKALGIPSGSLYPILFRYERAGWLKSEWENVDPVAVGRPRRRLYRLSDLGATKAAIVFREVSISFAQEPKWAQC